MFPRRLLYDSVKSKVTMSTATLSSKSQIVVPADVRASLGLVPGDQISIVVESDHAVLRKHQGSALDALAALIDPARLAGAMEDVERSREEWSNDPPSILGGAVPVSINS
jgi:AbrB family looped-hinge helix DNA binding protein